MTIQDILNDLSGVIHGTTTNKIPNVYGILNRAARAVLLDVDPKETQRIVQLSQVFNSVYDYAIPTDLKGDKIIDLRPQAGRLPRDLFAEGYAQTFDSQKSLSGSNKIYIQHNTGVKTIRIEAPTLTSPTPITDTGMTTGWTAPLSPSPITLDTLNNVAGGGALVFDIPASGDVDILNSTLTPIDISGYKNTGTLFLWVYLPDGSAVTNVTLHWGSSPTDYFSNGANTTQQGTAFVDGWNLLAFPWSNANEDGSPDATKINYVLVNMDNTNPIAQVGAKICNLTCAPGYIFEVQYYSKYLFRDPSTGAFQETVTDGDFSKLINLDTESYNLFFNKVAFFVAQSLQGADADYDASYWKLEYDNALEKYKLQNPGESLKKGETYYKLPKKGYNKYSASWWNK